MQKKGKNNKKMYIEKTEKIFSEPESQETVTLADGVTNGVTDGVTEGVTEKLLPFTQLCEILQISRKTGYNRMNFLQITPWKIQGKLFLDEVQIGYMNDLQEHYKQHGNFEGFPIPDPSGPWEEINNQLETTETPEESAIVLGNQTTAEITTSNPQQLNTTNSPSFAPAAVRSQATQELEAINNLVASAQNKATGVLIAENVLASQYIQNPDLLPDELKARINESAQTPVIDPFAYAESLINFAQKMVS